MRKGLAISPAPLISPTKPPALILFLNSPTLTLVQTVDFFVPQFFEKYCFLALPLRYFEVERVEFTLPRLIYLLPITGGLLRHIPYLLLNVGEGVDSVFGFYYQAQLVLRVISLPPRLLLSLRIPLDLRQNGLQHCFFVGFSRLIRYGFERFRVLWVIFLRSNGNIVKNLLQVLV